MKKILAIIVVIIAIIGAGLYGYHVHQQQQIEYAKEQKRLHDFVKNFIIEAAEVEWDTDFFYEKGSKGLREWIDNQGDRALNTYRNLGKLTNFIAVDNVKIGDKGAYTRSRASFVRSDVKIEIRLINNQGTWVIDKFAMETIPEGSK